MPQGKTAAEEDETGPSEGTSRTEGAVSALLAQSLPDRRLLVLFALERSGREQILDEIEREELEAARPHLEAALQASAALGDILNRIGVDAADFETAWNAARPETGARSVRRPIARDRASLPGRTRRVFRPVLFAAALTAVAAVGALLIGDRSPSTVLVVGRDAVEEVDLADGTTVRLTTGSTLTYRRPEKAERFDRKVKLEGSAYFVVAPDAGNPFVVQTAEATATVLGTRFGVVRRDGGTDVVLASGSVTVSSSSAPHYVVTLSPGTMSHVSAGSRASEPVEVDVVAALDWTGLFVFRGETYERIADHLSRHYGVPVTVAPEIAAERQTGTFDRSQGLSEILATMERSWGFSVQGDASGGYLLRPVP